MDLLGIFRLFRKTAKPSQPQIVPDTADAPDHSPAADAPEPLSQPVPSDPVAPDGGNVPTMAIEDAVASLRSRIIERITKDPSLRFELEALVWQDAAQCFPEKGFHWDLACFKLALTSGRLHADVSTYPNMFGACRESSYPVSAAEFHRIATEYHWSPMLRAFRSDEDWAKLFDDSLTAAVSSASDALQKQKAATDKQMAAHYSVKIPACYAELSPTMGLSMVEISLDQQYSSRKTSVTNSNGAYSIFYQWTSRMSAASHRHRKTLSPVEAVWLEKQVENTINDPNESTWHSWPGGDQMKILIRQTTGQDVSASGEPIRKYSDLQTELEHLAQYGSMLDAGSEQK